MPKTGLSKYRQQNLFSRLKNKDKEAFAEAYDLYADDLHRFIYFKIGNKEEANDLTSIVFLKTWDYLRNNSLLDSKTLKALLYKIARTSIIDFYRSRPKVVSLDDENYRIDVIDEKADPEAESALNSDLDLVKSKLDELKIEYRELIIMRFINELTLAEIADVTGKSQVNVRVSIFRALKALKDLINKDENK